MSKKIYVTLGDEQAEDLETWARLEGVAPGTIAGQLVVAGIRQAKIDGVLPETNELKMLLIRLASGEVIEDVELTILAGRYEIPVESLKRLRDCNKPKNSILD